MELRLYSFVNFYLSSIQQGIQTAHAAVDLVMSYRCYSGEQTEKSKMVDEWANLHKTMIVLNGGNNDSLEKIFWAAKNSGYPWAEFREDGPSLGSIRTCVAVVVPETIFAAKVAQSDELLAPTLFKYEKDTVIEEYGLFSQEFELIKAIKSCRLAQ